MNSPGCVRIGRKRFRINVAHRRHATRQRRRHRIVAVHDGVTVAVLHRLHRHRAVAAAAAAGAGGGGRLLIVLLLRLLLLM